MSTQEQPNEAETGVNLIVHVSVEMVKGALRAPESR
jgi:hypothetical protein